MRIYADNAATTKMSRAAIDAMVSCMEEQYGNPSSLYTLGQDAKELLEQARAEIASIIGASPREITFTSGGSEADNQAIRSAAAIGKRKGKKHIISTAFEHHAVLHTCEYMEKQGYEVTYLPVDEQGIVSVEDAYVLNSFDPEQSLSVAFQSCRFISQSRLLLHIYSKYHIALPFLSLFKGLQRLPAYVYPVVFVGKIYLIEHIIRCRDRLFESRPDSCNTQDSSAGC